MNPIYGFPTAREAGPAATKDGRLSLTVWIEQFQEVRGGVSAAPGPVRDWEDAWPGHLTGAATCRGMDELQRRVVDLANRIEALEKRSSERVGAQGLSVSSEGPSGIGDDG